ncbi:MAG TPA: 2-C-methyl-D-erythritol 4-phosphate cytidylyltransferase [Planctomycetota bacterium]
MPADASAVLLAAGRGRRMAASSGAPVARNKALRSLAGRPLLAHALAALHAAPSIVQVVLVLDAADVEALRREWDTTPAALGAHLVVPGGAERWLSSMAGCNATREDLPMVLIHDAARPLARPELFEAVLDAARRHGAALAAAPLADTLKRADPAGHVAATVPREGLWCAQTPQAFRRELLLASFAAWPTAAGLPTDEASLVEAAGTAPQLVAAPATNFKLTTAADLELAESLLARRARSGTP